MADDLEAELEAQLVCQREALTGINEALEFGGEESADQEGHAELLQMRDELLAAVSELESALLEIKRSRILQQLAAHTSPTGPPHGPPATDHPPPQPEPQPPPPQSATQAVLPAVQPGPAPSRSAAHQPSPPTAGAACCFRYMDGRWYSGRVHGPGRQTGTVSVVFSVPTRPFMLEPVDVMEALVRQQCNGRAAAAAAGPTAAPYARGGSSAFQGQPGGSLAEVAVGRRALALLPGARLYAPVEVVAVDAVRGTATVLPLLQQQQPYGGNRGSGGRGGGGEVAVGLALVTRHAHVTPPAEAEAATARGAPGGGGADGSDDDGSSDSSSGSVRALLRPAVAEDGEDSEDDADDYVDDADDDNDGDGGDDDVDLYGSDDDDDDQDDGGGGGRGGVSGRRLDAAAADDDEEGGGGLLDVLGHARLAAAAGAVDDAALLAEWEAHGRGVASRLLVRMGYVAGQGLGSRGQGTMAAPEVLLLPERKGLGAVDRERLRRVGGGSAAVAGGVAKRRSKRGGARQKRKRAIEAAREARAEAREAEEGAPGGGGLFDFINSSLGDSSAAARIRKAPVSVAGVAAGGGGAGAGGAQKAGAAAIAGAAAAASGGGPRRAPDRRGLMSHHDTVAGIQTKLSRLHEMLGRHKDNRGLRTQIEAQIRTVQAELAAAQSAAARASKAIHDKDAQKKWLKF